MGVLLRVTALMNLAWAGLLFGAPQRLSEGGADPVTAVLGYLLASHTAALAVLFWYGARAPRQHLTIVVLAITLAAAHIVVDLVGLLGSLPAHPAVYFVIDLLVHVALLVGLLEALPRTMATHPEQMDDTGV